MRIYHLQRTHILPITLQQAWDFFSSPANLPVITPSNMKFTIIYQSGGTKMYPGQLIRYRVRILPGVTVHWVTEITHVQAPVYFVDEQRFGPYALWHHQHRFREVPGGVEMIDEVNYAIGWGILGQIAQRFFVGGQVNAIFDYRFRILQDYFNKTTEPTAKTI